MGEKTAVSRTMPALPLLAVVRVMGFNGETVIVVMTASLVTKQMTEGAEVIEVAVKGKEKAKGVKEKVEKAAKVVKEKAVKARVKEKAAKVVVAHALLFKKETVTE